MSTKNAVEARKIMRRGRIAGSEEHEKSYMRTARRAFTYGEKMKKAAGAGRMKQVERFERLKAKAEKELMQLKYVYILL
jgi:hypothetical protein